MPHFTIKTSEKYNDMSKAETEKNNWESIKKTDPKKVV